MSTVSRRNKAAAAKAATTKAGTSRVARPAVSLKPERLTRTINGNGGGVLKSTPRLAKPILADLSKVAHYTLTDHAIEQMQARNISPAEALSAIADPDHTAQHVTKHGPNAMSFDRGDIRVVADVVDHCIVTVIDQEDDVRVTPRVPQRANLIEAEPIPAVLPVQKAITRVPKELPESEEIRWLFGKHLKEDIRYVDVSPAIAQALLDRNTRNRKKSATDVDDWSGEMGAGRWRITHQGIALARDGVILDGQHRLQGIVDSGVTVRMPIAVGLDPEVFTVIDTGRKRSAGDALGMVGEASATQLAAVVRMCWQYDNGLLGSGKNRGGKVNKVHHDVLLGYRAGKEDALREAVKVGVNVRAFGLKVNKTAMGTAYFLIKRGCNDDELVETFFEGVRVGADLARDDARFLLRRTIINDTAPTAMKHLALILKGWALFARGGSVKQLGWRIDEEMPIVYVPLPKLMR